MKKSMAKKAFVWYGTRIGMWLIVFLWIIAAVYPNFFLSYPLFAVLFLGIVICTFVSSIVHLNKYKEKSLAIVALVISSLFLILAFTFPSEDYYEPITIEDSGNVSYGNLDYVSFVVYIPSYLDLRVQTNEHSNIYLFEENEYLRYKDGSESYYLTGSENIVYLEEEDLYANTGNYYLVIETINDSLEYNYSLNMSLI